MVELDRIVRLHASLQKGAAWDELLRQERLTRAEWLAAERTWVEAMMAEAAAGKFEITDRYMQVMFGAPAASAHASTLTEAVLPDSGASSGVYVGPTSASRDFVPAAMRDFTDVDRTQVAKTSLESKPLPFAPPNLTDKPAGKPDVMPDWMPKGMRGLHNTTGTIAAPEAPKGPATPFEGKAVPPASSRAAPPKVVSTNTASVSPTAQAIPAAMRGMTDVHGTQVASESAGLEPVLPFDPKASPTLPQTSAGPAAWMPKGMSGVMDIDGTTAMADHSSGPIMPFKGDANQRPVSVAPAVKTPESAAPVLGARPAAAPVAPTNPAMSLENYAALCVELAMYPVHRVEVLRRYSIDEAQRGQLDAFWSPRVQMDPQLRAAWDGYYMAHWTRLHGAAKR